MNTEKKKKSSSKKIIKWLLVAIFLLVIGLVSIPFLFKDKIVAMIKSTANNNINATLSFKETDLSLFRDFPNASLRINDIAIINKAPFLGDTLFFSEKLDINLEITELFKNETETLSIKDIVAENSIVNILFNKDNLGNYDIAKTTEVTKTQNTESALALNIESYSASNLKFTYFDVNSKIKLVADSIYHTGKGNFANAILDLDTKSAANISFYMENSNYLKEVPVKLDAILGLDIENSKFTFKENTGYINELPLQFDGFMQLLENAQLYDINFKTPNSSFKNVLALLPKKYAGNLASITTSGNFNLNGIVKGTLSETKIPNLNITLSSKNARFKYADLPKAVTNINIDASIINKTGFPKDTYINLNNSSFKIDEDVFNANGSIANFTTNALIKLKAKGIINLKNISKVYPVALEKELQGILKADVITNFDMNSIEKENYQNIKNEGQISLSNFKYEGDDVANPFFIDNTTVTFNTNTIKLEDFKAKTGSSDVDLKGKLDNFYGFLFKDKKLQGSFNLNSNNIKVDDFMSNTKETKDNEPTSALKIPEFLDITINAKANNVLYDNIKLANVNGALLIKEETISLKNVNTDAFSGNIGFSGKVNTKGEKSKFNMNLDLNKLSINKAFGNLEMLKAIAPIAKIIEGKINTKLNVQGFLKDDLTPDLQSISGDLIGTLLNPKLNSNKSKVLNAVGSKIDFLDMNKLNLKDLKALLTFKNGQVNVAPLAIKYKDIGMNIDGTHGFDNNMNYNITFDVPVQYLGNSVTSILAKLNAKDASEIKSIPINATLTGSFSSPNFNTNIKQATTSLVKQLVAKQKASLVDKGKNKLFNILGSKKENEKDSIKGKETVKEAAKEKVKNVLNGLFSKKKKDTVN
ncbi:AsmA-like C-terminal region-containing protein [uncultured Polaribacter sp.]|uniref:AsmA-like C-terminal region-containing protein n=1 Tax=uncultured Polaribacter sp. TaxID=174711 RepID=UPI00260552D8|nr:AsmA-like C-terminal region-containing protein [uncultured Polaribacter sp.]